MRSFIAIPLAPEIREALSNLQQEFRRISAGVSWVKTENLHLTLKFLGEIDEKTLGMVISAVEECARMIPSFRLSVAGCGAFPNSRKPRVIWAGVREGPAELKQLAAALEETLQKIGIPKEEREFSSHITLGRVRSPGYDPKLASCIDEKKSFQASAPLSMRAEVISVFKSTLLPSGPRYETLKEASLTTA